jgi:hypothetical protein
MFSTLIRAAMPHSGEADASVVPMMEIKSNQLLK